MRKIKRNKVLIIVSAILFIILVFAEYYAAKRVNWTPTYDCEHKIPYGTYVLKDILKNQYANNFEENNKSLFEYFISQKKENFDFIFITHKFTADSLEFSLLLKHAKKGNNIFISAVDFSDFVKDTFNLKTGFYWKRDTVDSLFLNTENVNNREYVFEKQLYGYYFSSFDSSRVNILGTGIKGEANFIEIPVGQGNVFINMQPLAYSNYHILYSNIYSFHTLKKLKSNSLVWDNYYKPFKNHAGTPIRYILSKDELRFAYTLSLILILLYLLFASKRKQKAMAVLSPKKNTTIAFIKQVGLLNLSAKSYKQIFNQKVIYFNDFLRTKYFFDINKKDVDIKQLSEKTTVPKSVIDKLFRKYDFLKSKQVISKSHLLEFNKLLEDFYKFSG